MLAQPPRIPGRFPMGVLPEFRADSLEFMLRIRQLGDVTLG
jgi:hypothetical protein